MEQLSRLHRDSRDEKLWNLLPGKSDFYDPDRLSEAETNALREAMTDGFGGVTVSNTVPETLPKGLDPGLLQHSFFVRPDSEYMAEDDDGYAWDDGFWNSIGDDTPAPFEKFPLGFMTRRLRVYFTNQFERFCIADGRFSRRELRKERVESYLFDTALDRLYRKPWYEAHALCYLDLLDDPNFAKFEFGPLARFSLIASSGELGRLVEQYFWRFRYEGAAVRGLSTRNAASAGGQSRALIAKAQQARWQKEADAIWSRRRTLTKNKVAELVKKRLRLSQTAGNIARFIQPPASK